MKRISRASACRFPALRLFAGGKPPKKVVGPAWWISISIYLALSVLMTWPLASELNTHLPTPDQDVFNVFWGNWWVRHALGNGQNPYFTQYLIYPVGFNLFSFAFSPVLALIWIPLSWILPPLAAYNVLVLVTIILCCLAMDQLLRYLSGNAWAGLAAGVTFGFAPSLVAERLTHLNLSALFWLPWAVLLLTRLMRKARGLDAVLLALTVGLAFYTRPQVGVLVVLSCGVHLVGLALIERRQWHRLALRRLVQAGVLCLLLLVPLLQAAREALLEPGSEDLIRGGTGELQTDLLAYVLPPQRHPIFGPWTAKIYEQKFVVNEEYWAYVGLVPLLLVLCAVVSRPRQSLPWLLTGSFFFILALGPYLRLNGQVYPAVKLPYSLAPDLISAAGFNWPNRFNLALMAPLSVLVGLACAHVQQHFKKAWIPALATLLILGEYVVVPLPTILAPPHSDFYDQMAADDEEYAIVDLPLTRDDGEVHRYFQTIHHKPMVGGWDHRVPETALAFIDANPLLAPWRANDTSSDPGPSPDRALAELADAHVRYFILHKTQMDTAPEALRFLLNTLAPVYQDPDILVLSVESTSSQAYNVAHWFGDTLGLIQPTVFLDLPWDGRPPLLSAYGCWLRGSEVDPSARYRVTLTGPEGDTVFTQSASLPGSLPGLACELWNLELDSTLQAGQYDLSVTAFSGEQALDTYTMSLPIQILQTRRGTPFPAMGYSEHLAFDAPMELLGYNLVGGEGQAWVDLFWRSTAGHQASYSLSVQLLDPETGLPAAQVESVIPEHTWEEGDLYGERLVLWLDYVPPGRYSLKVVLEQRGSGTLGQSAILNVPLLVLPASATDSTLPQEEGVIAHCSAGETGP